MIFDDLRSQARESANKRVCDTWQGGAIRSGMVSYPVQSQLPPFNPQPQSQLPPFNPQLQSQPPVRRPSEKRASDPDFVCEYDPLERFNGLTKENLRVTAAKFNREYDLIVGKNNLDYALAYLRNLQIISEAVSQHYPGSFVMGVHVLADAKANWDLFDSCCKDFKAFEELKEQVGFLRDILLEFFRVHGINTAFTCKLDGIDIDLDLQYYDTDQKRLIEDCLEAVVREDSVITHIDSLCGALGHICDKPGKSIHNIMYTELDGRWVRTTMLNPRLQKELKDVCKIVNSIRGGIIGLLSLVLSAAGQIFDWMYSVLLQPNKGADAYYYYISTIRKCIMDGLNLVLESLNVDEEVVAPIKAVVKEVEDKGLRCTKKCLDNKYCDVNPLRDYLFPKREKHSYQPRRGPTLPDCLHGYKNIPKSFRGTRAVEDRFLFLTVSGDGVLMTENSKYHNSWYCFSFSVSGAPYMVKSQQKTLFFSFIIPENSATSLYCPDPDSADRNPETASFRQEAIRCTRSRFGIIDQYLALYCKGTLTRKKCILGLRIKLHAWEEEYVKKAKSCTIRKNKQRVYSPSCPVEKCNPLKIPEEDNKTQRAVTATNSHARSIISQILEEARKEGDTGLLVAYGDRVLHIRFGILSAKADLPAADDLMDSSGCCVSTHPCRFCGVGKQYFDANMLTCLVGINRTLWKGRDVINGLHAPFARTPFNCPLRWANHLDFLLRNGRSPAEGLNENCLDVFCEEYKAITKRSVDPSLKEDLSVLLEYLKKRSSTTAPYTPSDLTFFPPFLSAEESRPPTCAPYSNGRVELSKHLGFPSSHCVCMDLMHTLTNAVQCFLRRVLPSSTANTKGEAYWKEAISSLKRAHISIERSDGSVDWDIPSSVHTKAMAVLDSWGMQPTDHLYSAFHSLEELKKSKMHVVHELAFAYLPILLFESLHIPAVRCMVTALILCQKLYNSRRSLQQIDNYQTQLDLIMNEYEAHSPLNCVSSSTHYLSHGSFCIRIHGPLRDEDCWQCEDFYFNLRNSFVSTNDPSMTSFMKETTKSITVLSSKEKECLIELGDKEARITAVLSSSGVEEEELRIRTVFNYLSDSDYMANGLFRQITLWDIEKCTTVVGFWRLVECGVTLSLMNGNPVLSDNSEGEVLHTITPFMELKSFASQCGIPLLSSPSVSFEYGWSRCKCKSASFEAAHVVLKQLTADYVCDHPKCFAFVRDYNEDVHMYALCGFGLSKVENKRFEQVVAYEIPTLSLCVDAETTSCRIVDFGSEKMKGKPFLELLSVRRCLGNLEIRRFIGNSVVVITKNTNINQLIHHVPIANYKS